MPHEEEKPDILHVKRIPESRLNFHYNREERLKLRNDPNDKEAAKRKKILKAGKLLVIFLAMAIIILVSLLVYKYFFQ
ncbi:MAG: hypothetical protein EHM28_06165 [Spirochaetaceae bacterium]|nr:MAG: hypothetical protein EHM28_06165 [Spirochaetaceae bacterium]